MATTSMSAGVTSSIAQVLPFSVDDRSGSTLTAEFHTMSVQMTDDMSSEAMFPPEFDCRSILAVCTRCKKEYGSDGQRISPALCLDLFAKEGAQR